MAVLDDDASRIGGIQTKVLFAGWSVPCTRKDDEELCALKGKWTGWDLRFVSGVRESAHVSKKWGGPGKELFTSADNYMLQISDDVPADNPIRQLIIAAVMWIDMVLKE